MLKVYTKNIHCARFDTYKYHNYRETNCNARVDIKIMIKSLEREMYVKGTGSQCVLKGYAKNIHCARFDTHRYRSYSEMHFNARVEVKL